MGLCLSKKTLKVIKTNRTKYILNPSDIELMSIDPDSLPKIIYLNKIIKARVTDVYDGDTVTVIFLIGEVPVKYKIRLKGIDTPEIRAGKGKLKIEKLAAIQAKQYLSSLVLNKIVDLTIHGWDKYGGRVLGTIFFINQNINRLMIDNGYAKEYGGEKKPKWTRKELNKILYE